MDVLSSFMVDGSLPSTDATDHMYTDMTIIISMVDSFVLISCVYFGFVSHQMDESWWIYCRNIKPRCCTRTQSDRPLEVPIVFTPACMVHDTTSERSACTPASLSDIVSKQDTVIKSNITTFTTYSESSIQTSHS